MPLRPLAIGIALVALALALWLLVAAVRRRRWTSLLQVVPALGLLALVALLVPYIFGLNAPHPFFNRPAAVPAGTIVYYRYDPNSISNGANASVTLYAVDGQTGKALWQRLLGGFDTAVIGGSGGSVVYAAYTLSSDQSDGVHVHVHVLALDGATGSVLWQRALPGMYVPFGSLLADGTLFVGIAGYGPSRAVYVVALRASDGTQLWALPVSTEFDTLRLLASPGILYVQPTASVLQARRPTDGTLLWTHNGIQGIAVAGPDAVYTLSFDGSVTAYRAQTGAQLWQYGNHDVFHAGVYLGDTLYVTAQHAGIDSTYDASGHLINPETVYALDAATGQVRWTFATQYSAGGSLAAGPGVVTVIADGIYALRSSDGTLLWHTDPHIHWGVATTAPVVGSIVYVTAVQDLPPDTLSIFGPVYGQIYLYALNTADGSADWGVPIGPVFQIPSRIW